MHHLGANEAALQVGVDGPGGALGHRAPADRPGAHLVFAHRQEADQAQQRVGFAHHFAQPRRPQAHALAKLGGVLRRQLAHLHLQLRRDGDNVRVLPAGSGPINRAPDVGFEI